MNIILQFGLLVIAVSSAKAADIRYGSFVGSLTTFDYGVSGDVYIVDMQHIRIRNFYYNGQGPDAYFYYGKSGVASASPDSLGVKLMDENGRDAKLPGYSNADVVLTLPADTNANQILWLSVWCYSFGVDFGSLVFPGSLTVPTTQSLSTFSTLAHLVSSGPVTAINSRQIEISNFNYDGQGPDAFFWVGVGTPDTNGAAIPDENGSMTKLSAYTGQTITLTLPSKYSLHDITYISVWCKQAVQNFGHVTIPSGLSVIPYTADITGYYGKLVGDISNFAHEVYGTLYIVDQNHIRLRNFSYDGQGPDAYFYLGMTSSPDTSGITVPNEMGMMSVLGAYESEDIVITLPDGSLSAATWFSVWCKQFRVDFGSIMLPNTKSIPAPMPIGQFAELAHAVKSGTVTILDTRTIRIENLVYDGQGPAAFFYIGNGTVPDSNGMAIPDEMGSMTKLREYMGETITLTLPEGYSFLNIQYLSIWCETATQNFGHVLIPANLFVPPKVVMIDMRSYSNCVQFDKFFNVAWEIEGNFILFEFTGALENNGYMAFGISGSQSRSSMLLADVAVASFNNEAIVTDYYLSQYAQCSGGVGACPDVNSNGNNDISDVLGYQINGITTIRFKKPLVTGDANDIDVPVSGSTYIVWSMGILSNDGFVTKHNLRLTADTQVQFGGTGPMTCQDVMSRDPGASVSEPWTGRSASSLSYTARIGPAGPEKHGYAAITEQQSWGIAWYINGQLIPEITMFRGETYTFNVEGGDDTSNLAKYHPFYITNDREGGYERKTAEERALVEVYAGVDMNGNPTAVGRFCEYKETPASAGQTMYQAYLDSLVLECADGTPSVLTWTPDANTPDTVYYQCFTHRYLGWKIKVMDMNISSAPKMSPTWLFAITYILIKNIYEYVC